MKKKNNNNKQTQRKPRSYITDDTVPRRSVIGRVVFVLQARENNTSSVSTQEDPDTLV